MASAPLILGFDTSAAHCAAALLLGDTVLASRAEAMTKGQAERLMPLLEEILSGAGVGWQDLTALGVGIGPGNFTGIRIAVSAARGLALGLDVPAVGVSGCEARAHLAPKGALCAIPAPRGMVYLCDPDSPSNTPQLMPLATAQAAGLALAPENSPQGLAEAIAAITAAKWQTTTHPPAPLYARAADAAPSRHAPPVMLD
ncbi:MAG: tRNA threonylcarbamoyladenosine biosynthesis protein TsaB [Paracoccaceae bacterium]|jgi:tRNA threonylcarbamoyladenosine biosynthesis protein TsaB